MASVHLAGAAAYLLCGIGLCYVYLHFSLNRRTASSGPSSAPVQQSRIYVGNKKLLPDNLDVSETQLQLEFRAVFSKEWLYATHSARFQKPGDYHSMTVGGYPILVVMGKDNTIRAFHDVCRHRAYKVTKKSTGCTLAFACRYHGWSYDTKGALIRAPEFEKEATFRRDENGLISVRLQTSLHGLVFVNFSSNSADLDLDPDALERVLPGGLISPSAHLIHEVEVNGAFNWKVLATKSFSGDAGRLPKTDFHIFPSARISWSNTGSYWVSLIFEPLSADKTHVRLEIFGAGNSAAESKPNLGTIEKQARQYVQTLEQLHREIRNSSVHPAALDQSFTDFQTEIDVRSSVHAEAERMVGHPVRSVSSQKNVSMQGLKDDLFCEQLERECENLPCQKADAGKFAW